MRCLKCGGILDTALTCIRCGQSHQLCLETVTPNDFCWWDDYKTTPNDILAIGTGMIKQDN